MRDAYDETISQIMEACLKVVLLTHKAHELESRGEGSILDYGLISDCASKIQVAADQRGKALARVQWDDELRGIDHDLRRVKAYLYGEETEQVSSMVSALPALMNVS